MKVEVKKLTKYYDKTLGIKDVSFKLDEGEIFGFIGPNGAGKSTTIRSIMNLINKSGLVLIDGKEFKGENQIKKKIGYLPSEINLYEDLTVKEMLDYHEKFYGHFDRRENLIKRFCIDETKKLDDLSFGNLKKLGIILTFMNDFELYILDEPTNGLDPIMQKEFYKLIKEEKKQGKTIIYSSHILSEVSRVCDRVGIIKDGELIYVDTVSSLLKNKLNVVTIESKEISKIIENLKLKDFLQEENYIKFKTSLTGTKLIEKISQFKIDKILIEEPTLEDIVMDYYK